MRLRPLGDQAVLAYCDDEAEAFALAGRLHGAGLPWLVDVVQAYLSVAAFYDGRQVDYGAAVHAIEAEGSAGPGGEAAVEGRLHRIPCCYEMGLDLGRIAEHTGLSADEVITRHAGATYTVYAIGFCPGFPYLGYLPDELAHVPRLPSPRVRLEAGSVGLTGRQTGIYTEARPGGWNIVGRTPLTLVDVQDGYFPLRTGDRVQFEPISAAEFGRLGGERLPVSA